MQMKRHIALKKTISHYKRISVSYLLIARYKKFISGLILAVYFSFYRDIEIGNN